MLYPDDPIVFPQPPTDDRKDFELNVSGDYLIVFKSPALTVVSIPRKFKRTEEVYFILLET